MTEISLSPNPNYLISPSQFSVHKDCSFKHQYVYGLSLRPKQREGHFEVGTYFHELAHHAFKTMRAGGFQPTDPAFLALIEQKLQKDLAESKSEYLSVLMQVHIMFRWYLERQAPQIDSNLEIIDVEREVIYPIIDGVSIQGILDLVYRKRTSPQIIIRDHKTGANKASHTEEGLELNDQLMTYACLVYFTYGEVPIIEISWINSKVNWSKTPTHDQLYNRISRKLDKNTIESFWKYLQEYVYHMQATKPIRALSSFNCKNCVFKEPCLFDLRGLDQRPILDANYKKVPRDYDFIKFTEITRKHSGDNRQSKPVTINIPSLGKSYTT